MLNADGYPPILWAPPEHAANKIIMLICMLYDQKIRQKEMNKLFQIGLNVFV
jgi:hypothetical protein